MTAGKPPSTNSQFRPLFASHVVLEDATGRQVAIGDFHLVDVIWVFLYPVLYLV